MRLVFGITIWVLMLVSLGSWITGGSDTDRARAKQLLSFMGRGRIQVELRIDPMLAVQVGDPIFLDGAASSPPVGRLVRVESSTSRYTGPVYSEYAVAEFFGVAPAITTGNTLTLHESPQSMGWVVETMLPPKKREELTRLIAGAVIEHQAEISATLQPILLDSLRRSGDVVQRDFQQAVLARSDRLKEIAKRYQSDFVGRQLTPLLTDEILPIIQRELRPLAEHVGQQLWQQASIWRLTWRALYDASPLPQRDLARKEFDRFVQDHAIGIIRASMPDFIEAQKVILAEIGKSEKLRNVVADGLKEVARDSELHAIFLEILQEVITDNPRLKQVWQDVWTSPEARIAMADASNRLEPTITAIGEAIFGNPKKAITPEFSKVLRSKVLFKDQRWLVLHLPTDGTATFNELKAGDSLPLTLGDSNAENPFHIPARPRK